MPVQRLAEQALPPAEKDQKGSILKSPVNLLRSSRRIRFQRQDSFDLEVEDGEEKTFLEEDSMNPGTGSDGNVGGILVRLYIGSIVCCLFCETIVA